MSSTPLPIAWLSTSELQQLEALVGPIPTPQMAPVDPAAIRAAHRSSGKRFVILDDDPTGSQTVHDVDVVTGPSRELIERALNGATACFVLTNSRSLAEPDAVGLVHDVAAMIHEVQVTHDDRLDVVSRGDSTLRGHVIAEPVALHEAQREWTGRGYDGILFVPAYFEAGRFTAGDQHWVRAGGQLLPAAESEFSRDATFGYDSSDLRQFLADKADGAFAPRSVLSLTLTDIRIGGVARVTEILSELHDGQFVVVNALDYSDLHTVVLGLLESERQGRRYLYRTGPSFVSALIGQGPTNPLTAADLPLDRTRADHGVVIVGSHVALTTAQVSRAAEAGGFAEIELDVTQLLTTDCRDGHIAAVSDHVTTALRSHDVLLCTSRQLQTAGDATASLELARRVSSALVNVVSTVRESRPAWIVAKGGITSHDVAVHGLGIRRARVAGQFLPGLISVWEAIDAPSAVQGIPYVVFAGNVGDEYTLLHVVETLRKAVLC